MQSKQKVTNDIAMDAIRLMIEEADLQSEAFAEAALYLLKSGAAMLGTAHAANGSENSELTCAMREAQDLVSGIMRDRYSATKSVIESGAGVH